MPPITRFCASCGAPANDAHSHCSRCGAVLALQTPPPVIERRDDGPRSSVPSLLVGLIACGGGGLVFLICGGIVFGLGVPAFLGSQAQSKAAAAPANLKALWAAEEAWAASHDGEFLEFYVDEEDATDPNFRRLKVDVGTLHHAYEAYYDGDVFMITASGNIDEDESYDEWEISSDDPSPYHLYDDLLEVSHYEEDEYEGDDDDHDDYEEGGIAGGVVGGEVSASSSLEMDAKARTARTNLEAIWKSQKAYKSLKKKYMSFDRGTEATWTALGLSGLPEAENHTYSAVLEGSVLTLTAKANLDNDAFEDEWQLSSDDGLAYQVKNDSLNLDLTELAGVLKDLEKEPK